MEYFNYSTGYQIPVDGQEAIKNTQNLADANSQPIDEIKPTRKKLNPAEKIALLEAKKKKIETAMQAVREKVNKNETRKKILIGAAILQILENPNDDRIDQEGLASIMNEFLTRDSDRKLFDLDAISK